MLLIFKRFVLLKYLLRYLAYKRDNNELLLFVLRGLAGETATYMRNRSATTSPRPLCAESFSSLRLSSPPPSSPGTARSRKWWRCRSATSPTRPGRSPSRTSRYLKI